MAVRLALLVPDTGRAVVSIEGNGFAHGFENGEVGCASHATMVFEGMV